MTKTENIIPLTSEIVEGLTYWNVVRADGTRDIHRCDEDIARFFHGN